MPKGVSKVESLFAKGLGVAETPPPIAGVEDPGVEDKNLRPSGVPKAENVDIELTFGSCISEPGPRHVALLLDRPLTGVLVFNAEPPRAVEPRK